MSLNFTGDCLHDRLDTRLRQLIELESDGGVHKRESGDEAMISAPHLNNRPDDDDVIQDEAERLAEDEPDAPRARYEVSYYGVDFDVRGLVTRLQEGEIIIPPWQRDFVWTPKMASAFIESLLLGLPVPGIFLARDPDTKEFYIVDGQQRLRSLMGFYEGNFPQGSGDRRFALTGVAPRFKGMTYNDLKELDRRELNNSLIHATVVKQDFPVDDDTSLYQIFKRLNSGGRPVNPHEIRRAVYQGALMDEIERLNDNSHWREIVGKPSLRFRDREMILRFMAMLHMGDKYSSPMEEFLNVFVQTNRNPDEAWMRDTSDLFERTVKAFAESMGNSAFRVIGGRVVNAAVFDSMSVALATRIKLNGIPSDAAIQEVHNHLISDEAYFDAITQGTSQERSVERRLKIAKAEFENA